MANRAIHIISTLLIIIITSSAARARVCTFDAALDSLDKTLAQRPAVMAHRRAVIDSLKGTYNKTRSALNAGEVANAYRSLNIDSALVYYQISFGLAENARDTVARNTALIEYAGQLGKSGYFTEALATLDTIAPEGLSPILKLRYYDLKSQIYIDGIGSTRFKERRGKMMRNTLANLDSLTTLLPPNTIGRRMTTAMRHSLCGDTTLAEGELKEFFDSIPLGHPLYGIASGMLASIYRNRPDRADEYLYYLALASTADAKNGVGEAYTLEQLGSEMFKRGDFERAYNYMTVSGEAIHELGTRRHFTYNAPPLAILLETMHRRDRIRHISFIVTLCLMVVVIAVFSITVSRIARRNKAQRRECSRLAAIAASKDRYIMQLLDLCASYNDSMEELNRLVGRKIKAGQAHDLYETVESGKILRQQTEKFFTSFDAAVLNIFPDFVAEINSMLDSDKRIALSEPGVLNPELRIAAFMRLGVTDSTRISKFLGLSLNTVYTYRNRLKSRAKNRDTFESDILKIGDIS